MKRIWVCGGLCAFVLASALSGCRGSSVAFTEGGEGETTPFVVDEQTSCDPGPSPVRRLTRREYNNTVHDLLGDTSQVANNFPAEEEMLGFNNNADTQAMSPVLAEKYLDAAEFLSTQVSANFDALTGCSPAARGEDACARELIRELGAKTFRRPISSDDEESLFNLFAERRTASDFAGGIEAVVQVLLQSPEFLYRIEFGEPVKDQPGVNRLDDYEIASRLSYFLWGSMPDDTLFEAAERGELSSEEQVEAHALRLIADPKAKETVREFHTQWLGLGGIEELAKDPTHYPDFSDSLKPLLRAEADALIDEAVWGPDGSLKTLFTADYTYLNGPLATFYGLQGPSGDSFERVVLPEGRAAGVLTQGGLLSVLAKPNLSSPIHRGIFVREKLMCEHIAPPPDNAMLTPPDPDRNASTRERFAQHRADPACEGCHVLMDPIGFGFEHFDGVGRYRETENGAPVDATGEVNFSPMGTFDGVVELGGKLAEDEQVQQCVTRQWFRFAQGRAELEGDRCSLDFLQERFIESGFKIPELMISITQMPSFRFRTAPDGAQTP